jgi:glycosyltransferase involved in cell wall biosynthesis
MEGQWEGDVVTNSDLAEHPRTSSPRVAVALAVFNQARFLGDALESVAAQTRPADEVIVVDDASTDRPDLVAAGFEGVRLIQRTNGGLSAARNTALQATTCDRIIFLDADDVLEPEAVAAGLACFKRNPLAAFVYGAHRRTGPTLETIAPYRLQRLSRSPYHQFLLGNAVGMHATAMFDVGAVRVAGGFDEGLPRCEDHDLYCRLSRSADVAFHETLVAGYRQHGLNMSGDHRTMLHWALVVHGRHRPQGNDPEAMRAWRLGLARWRAHYAVDALKSALRQFRMRDLAAAVVNLVTVPPLSLAGDVVRRVRWLVAERR